MDESKTIVGIKITKTFKSGMTVQYAFFVINNISGNTNRLYIDVIPYFNQQAYERGLMALEDSTQYNFVPEGDHRWDIQAYDYLMSLEEFDGAIEVRG